MISEKDYISITDLQNNALGIISSLGTKIILSQNKPVGVFLSLEEYNKMQFIIKKGFENATSEDLESFEKSSHGKDGIEAFEFLKSLEKDV